MPIDEVEIHLEITTERETKRRAARTYVWIQIASAILLSAVLLILIYHYLPLPKK